MRVYRFCIGERSIPGFWLYYPRKTAWKQTDGFGNDTWYTHQQLAEIISGMKTGGFIFQRIS